MNQNDIGHAVLIVDDTPDDIEAIVRYLPKTYRPVTAATYEEAQAILRNQHIVLAIVDLFLTDSNLLPHGGILRGEFPHVPFLLMSGKDGAENTTSALQQFRDSNIKIVSKEKQLEKPEQVEYQVNNHVGMSYNQEMVFDHKNGLNWTHIANRLRGDGSDDGLQAHASEIEMLLRMAFRGWDSSDSTYVRAVKVTFEDEIHIGNNSTVLRLSLWSQSGAPQSEVVLKITRNDKDHGKFSDYKNVLGGYGLREQCYARTCNYFAHVYAVPYFSYDETKTYREYFKGQGDAAPALENIARVTDHLLRHAMGHLNARPVTSRDKCHLRDYYLERIGTNKREEQITRDLSPDGAPNSLSLAPDGATLAIRIGGKKVTLANPVSAVLRSGQYKQAGMSTPTALRHGDLHTANIIVDPERCVCWYIDYESFNTDHFSLVDHVELEASILFSTIDIKMDADLSFWATFFDAATPVSDLTDLVDVSAQADSPDDAREARKAFAALQVIRKSAAKDGVATASVLPYYHALMFEALRTAGSKSKTQVQRWHALVCAAQLFKKLEEA